MRKVLLFAIACATLMMLPLSLSAAVIGDKVGSYSSVVSLIPDPWEASLIPDPWEASLIPDPWEASLIPDPWEASLIPDPWE